jgi:hypothetical protein
MSSKIPAVESSDNSVVPQFSMAKQALSTLKKDKESMLTGQDSML